MRFKIGLMIIITISILAVLWGDSSTDSSEASNESYYTPDGKFTYTYDVSEDSLKCTYTVSDGHNLLKYSVDYIQLPNGAYEVQGVVLDDSNKGNEANLPIVLVSPSGKILQLTTYLSDGGVNSSSAASDVFYFVGDGQWILEPREFVGKPRKATTLENLDTIFIDCKKLVYSSTLDSAFNSNGVSKDLDKAPEVIIYLSDDSSVNILGFTNLTLLNKTPGVCDINLVTDVDLTESSELKPGVQIDLHNGYTYNTALRSLTVAQAYKPVFMELKESNETAYNSLLNKLLKDDLKEITWVEYQHSSSSQSEGVLATAFYFVNESIELDLGQSVIPAVVFEPEDVSSKELTWLSSDESIAIVNNGEIVAVSEGVCTITAKCKDGSECSDSIVVTIYKPLEDCVVNGISYKYSSSIRGYVIEKIPDDVSGDISIPSGLKEIPRGAFYGKDITSISIPSTVTLIGDNAFSRCAKLDSVVIEGSDIVIGSNAFSYTLLKSITFSDSNAKLTIGSAAFQNTALTVFEFPIHTGLIDTDAFKGTPLNNMTICPDMVFTYNTSSPIPGSVQGITVEEGSKYTLYKGALYDGTKLIYILPDMAEVCIKSGTDVMLSNVFNTCPTMSSLVFEENVTVDIPDNCFMSAGFLSSVDMSKSAITKIGDRAFSGTYVEEIIFPKTITSIGTNAFSGCSMLRAVNIEGDGTLAIGTTAFKDCTELVSVSISRNISVTQERYLAGLFTGCMKLSNLEIGIEGSAIHDADNALLVSDTSSTVWFVIDGATQVVLPENIKTIGCFCGANTEKFVSKSAEFQVCCDGQVLLNKDGTKVLDIVPFAEKLVLPDTVTEIEQLVLDRAISLTSLTWGSKDNSNDILVPFTTKSNLKEIVITTTGKVSVNSFSGISGKCEVTISCGELEVRNNTSFFDSKTAVSVSIMANKITGTGFLGGSVSKLDLVSEQDLNLASLFKDGKYGTLDIIVNGVPTDSVKAILGYTLSVNLSDKLVGGSVKIASLQKGAENYALIGIIGTSEGYTTNDLSLTYDEEGTPVALGVDQGYFKVVLTSDLVVSADVKKDSDTKHTVTFDVAGGSMDQSLLTLTVSNGRTINNSDIASRMPVYEGYEFIGWYTDASLSAEYTKEVIVSDITLYAKWLLVEGHTVTFDDTYGLVSAVDSKGHVFLSGEKVLEGEAITFELKGGNGVEFLSWNITCNGKTTQSADRILKITVSGDTVVVPDIRYYAYSNALINLTSLPTPTGDLNIVWSKKFDVDTSMSTWTGVPSVPVIVDGYVYVRASNDLIKIDISSGEVVNKVTTPNTTVRAYYHYLGYGGGVIIDYSAGKAYDTDLKELYELPKAFRAVFFEDGFFYGLADGLWKMDAKTGELATSGKWSEGVATTGWHSIYGTTSSPVFLNGWLYYTLVSGEDRGIGGINLETGESFGHIIPALNGYYLDDGWLSTYTLGDRSYVFTTGYSNGLFASGIGNSILAWVEMDSNGVVKDGSDRQIYLKASGSASALVVVNGRGYINVTGTDNENSVSSSTGGVFYVLDVDAMLSVSDADWTEKKYSEGFNGYEFVIYTEDSISTHGSIVVSTCYTEKTGEVFIYLLSYNSGTQAVYIFTDWDGKDSASGYFRSIRVGMDYCSQAVRVGANGELVWYTDSGELWCVKAVPYEVTFIVDDKETIISHSYGEEIEEPATDKVGHTFVGWFADKELSIPVHVNKYLSGSMSLYAKFEINKYVVTFMNGDSVFAEVTVEHGKTVTAPADVPQVPEGKVFVRWDNLSDDTVVTAPMTFNAVVEDGNKADDGSITYEVKEQDGSTTTTVVDASGNTTETNVISDNTKTVSTETKKDSEGKVTEVSVESVAKPSESGQVSDAAIDEILEKISSVESENTSVKVEKTVTIESSGDKTKSAAVSTESVKKLADAGVVLVVSSEDKTQVSIPADALKTISKTGAAGNVTVSVVPVDVNTLNVRQKAVVGDNSVFELSAAVGSTQLHNEMGGVTVTVPFTATNGTQGLSAWYVDDDGNVTEAKNVSYNAENKTVTFTVDHFSKYVVGYGIAGYSTADDMPIIIGIAVVIIVFTLGMLYFIRRAERA